MSDIITKRGNKKTTIARENKKTGFVEIVDKYTGEIIAYQSSREDLLSYSRESFKEVKLREGKTVLLEHGIDLEDAVSKTFLRMSNVLVDIFCERVAGGRGITDVCSDPDMPTHSALSRWLSQYPECKEQLAQAKGDRAETMFDKAIQQAENTNDKDEVPINRFKHDVYKYGAQVLRPAEFSPTRNVKADVNVASRIVIETGVRRAGDEGFFVDETMKLALDEAREVEEDITSQGDTDGNEPPENNNIDSTASISNAGDSAESFDSEEVGSELYSGSGSGEHGYNEGGNE